MAPNRDPDQTRFPAAGIALGAFAACCIAGLFAWQAASAPSAAPAAPLPAAPVAERSADALADLALREVAADELTRPPRAFETKRGVLRRGGALSDLLISLGATRSEAHRALEPVFAVGHLDARRVRPGLSATLTFDGAGDTRRLLGISLRAEAGQSVLTRRMGDGAFTAAKLSARLTPRPQRVAGEVSTSLYEAALAEGANDQHVVDFASIFAYDIDFQREIHPGDRFELVYESLVDERGRPVQFGQVLFARLDGRTLTRDFYFYVPSDDGVSDYFDPDGASATRFLMKTPINGARLSSGFGTRRHPISGYTRLHKGTDFAAPTGTPVYAAGHGTVERASRWGTYGHYVRLRHANNYKTAYAHLSRYGPGIRAGAQVRQGDVIGYVGSTGASTGPHLHYEVMIRGMHVNAMALDLPTGRKLAETPEELAAFLGRKAEIDAMRRALGADIDVADMLTGPDAG
ncbi:MAG: M23 family metallopeptidase [Pseudomonadota bacterium]